MAIICEVCNQKVGKDVKVHCASLGNPPRGKWICEPCFQGLEYTTEGAFPEGQAAGRPASVNEWNNNPRNIFWVRG